MLDREYYEGIGLRLNREARSQLTHQTWGYGGTLPKYDDLNLIVKTAYEWEK